jgi:hypothetical protein
MILTIEVNSKTRTTKALVNDLNLLNWKCLFIPLLLFKVAS